jgi:endo-1,4-beta-xylanase
LHYNDFNIENAGPKAAGALNIIKTLQAAGTKIDGVGLQSHFIVGASPSKVDLISTIGAYSALGIEVLIPELDIRMTLPVTDAQLEQQSTDYQNTIEACLTANGCVAATVWDFADEVYYLALAHINHV